MADFTIQLPWPDKALSPNARVHWAAKAKATKNAKIAAHVMTRQATRPVPWPRVTLEWAFHPKTRNAIDLDNIVASCKAYQDGISAALGVDDSLFDTSYRIADPVKGGLVVVGMSKPEFVPL
jgi:crossover junction endodeoxyribonuclease RusA